MLNFVMQQAFGGGVTRSPALDAHGKSPSSALLELEIDAQFGDTNPPSDRQRSNPNGCL